MEEDNRQQERQGSGDSSVRTGGTGRTSKGGKGQAGMSGAWHAKGHREEKGGKWGGQGRQWPQPQQSFEQPPPGSPPRGQCGGGVGGGEGGVPPAGSTVQVADARGAPAPSPPAPGARTGHHLPVGDGVREDGVGAPGGAGEVGRGAQRAAQWRGAERGRSGRTEQRSGGGAPRLAGGRAREWEPARWTHRQRNAGQG